MKCKKYLVRFLNLGYDESIYDDFQTEIAIQNSRMVETTSFIGSIMMLLLSVAALFVPSIGKVLPLYLTTAILFISIYAIVKIVGGKNRVITLLCNYAFLTAAFFFALGLDVIQKNSTATTVCVLLVALPLLIVDRPHHELLYFLIITVCFMLESVYLKQSPKASIDVLNGISFLIVGSFLGYKHNQMVLRNIRGQRLLEVERDTDSLTNLYNKGALESKVAIFLKKKGAIASLIVIDMDNFKFINDTYGHHVGDEILAKIGALLKTLFQQNELLCRFGGDEFIIFLPMTVEKELLQAKAEQLLEGVAQIRISVDENYRAHICMGIASYPKDGDNFSKLFKNADTAMYQVKKNGKNGYGFFDGRQKKKLLVVDDIEMNRAILKKILGNEYNILEAEDGDAALKLLENNLDIAMVITDIQMPNMDGIELIRRIRADKKFDETAIIANTQHGDLKQEEKIIQLGIDDFVYKAASPHVIQMRVKNVMKAKEL